MTPMLHIPLDFERREYVRRFRRSEGGNDTAIAMVIRMWVDWATAGCEFRKIRDLPEVGSSSADSFDPEIKWDELELTYIIEEFCGWGGRPGDLIKRALESGVLELVTRDFDDRKVEGLILADFWQFNSHLSPLHKTIQQRGAMAMHAKRSASEIRDAASQQVEIIADRGIQFALPIDTKPTTEEIKRCVTLIMMIYRACGQESPKAFQFTKNETLMTSAFQAIRKYSNEDMNTVFEYIIANRENPRLGKIPHRIIERFGEHLRKASNGVAAN